MVYLECEGEVFKGVVMKNETPVKMSLAKTVAKALAANLLEATAEVFGVCAAGCVALANEVAPPACEEEAPPRRIGFMADAS